MNANYRELAKSEPVFFADCGYADSRHVNNLSERNVPQNLLDAVERGCPVETLDELAKDFPICKYRTQITIHGLFPALSTDRIGRYVNIVRNKNGSVGVRWSAIDSDKKRRLYKRLAVYGGFRVYESSSEHYAYKMIPVTRETAQKTIDELRAQAKAIDQSLFFGSVSAFLGSVMGLVFACLEVRVNAFYGRNFASIVKSVTGLSDEQMKERTCTYLAERRQKAKDRAKREEEYRAKSEDRKRKAEERKSEWLKNNPCPFAPVENYTLQVGDVFAKIRYGYGSEGWSENEPKAWEFFIVKKSFGRLTAQPCDINGGKLTGSDRFRKGHAIPMPTGTFNVRKSA